MENFNIINHNDSIEYEISDNISLMYSKINNGYYIYDIDEEFDAFKIDIDENFNGMTIDNVYITKEYFLNFKIFIDNLIS
jgi:glutathionyl-hydroquinone reductase